MVGEYRGGTQDTYWVEKEGDVYGGASGKECIKELVQR